MIVQNKPLVTFDIEIYPNYLLIAFKNPINQKTLTFEVFGNDKSLTPTQIEKLTYLLSTRTIFGFNSNSFDIPVILLALKKATVSQIKLLADRIINEQLYQWQSLQLLNMKQVPSFIDHFDIKEVAIGVRVSLKLYGGRLHSTKLQELPFDPTIDLTQHQSSLIKAYCVNDLDTNIDLYNAIEPSIKLRQAMSYEYNTDFRSKSDAQIAEALIKHELEKLTQIKLSKPKPLPEDINFSYKPPSYLEFKTPQLQELLTTVKNLKFSLTSTGNLELPKELKNYKIKIGNSTYKLGIGGLHSTEKCQAITANSTHMLCDRDVASYYPSMIINNHWYPAQLGKPFLDLYTSIYKKRLAAKASGDKVTSDTFKIVLNGSFGKLGSRYSILYSPDLLLQVTLTGQLSLLMLIEELELEGISVVSANTDGFVSYFRKELYPLYDAICNTWELNTNLSLEETQYRALYSRDVNNYLAITTTNKTKGKGIFTLGQLSKNPQYEITILAAIAYLKDLTHPEQTIRSCDDITKFCCVRSVTGGAQYNGSYLGKVVRWVYTTDGQPITYKKNGNKVATSDGAYPIMDLSSSRHDNIFNRLDYEKYISITSDIIKNVGVIL